MTKKHDIPWQSDFQRAVAIGMLLGDGSLSCGSRSVNYHLVCYHSEKQIGWLEQKHRWLVDLARPIQFCSYLDKRDGKTRSGARFHTVSAPIITELRQLFYPKGKKYLSQEVVRQIEHPVTLAVLIGDDGSWDTAGIQIATKQFSEAENVNLSERLNSIFDLNTIVRRATYRSKDYAFLRIPAADVPRVRDLCLPHLPASMIYKIGGEDYQPREEGTVTYTCEVCGAQFVDWKYLQRRYCSQACAKRPKPSKRAERACDHCGKTFTYMLHTPRRFCSRTCRYAALSYRG